MLLTRLKLKNRIPYFRKPRFMTSQYSTCVYILSLFVHLKEYSLSLNINEIEILNQKYTQKLVIKVFLFDSINAIQILITFNHK